MMGWWVSTTRNHRLHYMSLSSRQYSLQKWFISSNISCYVAGV